MKTIMLVGAIASMLSVSLVDAKESLENQATRKEKPAFSFALIGDTPYGDDQVSAFNNVIDAINDDHSVRFVMHAGDIKSGGANCDDNRILARFEQFQIIEKPFIYTPGDNEWTDCHRISNGQYYPLERLGFLRSVFFPEPGITTGGKQMKVTSQGNMSGYEDFVENVMFMKHQVMFASLHVVGSNNNLRPWSGIDATDSFENPRADRLAEYKQRLEAVLFWINAVFDKAEHKDAKGVFLMMQANPRLDLDVSDLNRTGFNAIIDLIRKRTQEFEYPVVLAHGDFHTFFIDKPLNSDHSSSTGSKLLANFTRVQTFGSPHMHWIKVNVNPKSSSVFSFVQQIVPDNQYK